eukprot:CAMPEP_0119346998 /NCGR_PEP_ID=MMETSP1333-20130426/108295_1 /TAXON_ID=418940 /ORGANISM="Scyphosphaera apsteinii, Strain RCC1455" /LENGTH=147 /DNA_ID=CAMNT_0007359525 /DNA_START=131 /DNA_END=572 /DNA_ORIENTATION=-
MRHAAQRYQAPEAGAVIIHFERRLALISQLLDSRSYTPRATAAAAAAAALAAPAAVLPDPLRPSPLSTSLRQHAFALVHGLFELLCPHSHLENARSTHPQAPQEPLRDTGLIRRKNNRAACPAARALHHGRPVQPRPTSGAPLTYLW